MTLGPGREVPDGGEVCPPPVERLPAACRAGHRGERGGRCDPGCPDNLSGGAVAPGVRRARGKRGGVL